MFTYSLWAARGILAFIVIAFLLYAIAFNNTAQESRPVIASFDSMKPSVEQKNLRGGSSLALNAMEAKPTPSLPDKQSEDDGRARTGASTSKTALRQLENDPTPHAVQVASSNEQIEQRFSERNQQVHKFCSNLTSKDLNPVNRIKGIMELFAQQEYSWCRIAKVGTTFLKYLTHNVFGPGSKVSEGQRKSFFIVREPYSRMVSGYIGKIVTNQPWWRMFGRHIVSNHRINATRKEKNCGNDVTFPEFVKYFIHSQTTGERKNNHFVPMFELCNPCTESFDYILHLETLKDDLSFILETVNMTKNLDYSNEYGTIRGKAKSIVSQRKQISQCEPMCTALRNVWWSFHARGLISRDITFPLKEEECDSIAEEEFALIALEAHAKSIGKIDKSKQKRDILVDLYLQVPLLDRLKVRDLLAIDFGLYGYDPQPKDLFPEL